jgi:hypothetical protein
MPDAFKIEILRENGNKKTARARMKSLTHKQAASFLDFDRARFEFFGTEEYEPEPCIDILELFVGKIKRRYL